MYILRMLLTGRRVSHYVYCAAADAASRRESPETHRGRARVSLNIPRASYRRILIGFYAS